MSDYLSYEKVAGRTTDATAKTADTTVAIDDVLQVGVVNGETYAFEALLRVNSAAAADIDLGLSLPAGSSGEFFNAAAPSAPVAHNAELTVSTDGSNELIHVAGYIVAGADGTFGLTWAQNVSNAGETKVLAGSMLKARNLPGA